MATTRARPRPTPVDMAGLALIGALLAVAGIAWAATAGRMAGMDAGPGTDVGAVGSYVTTWIVMMAAMMFPSISPMVVMHSRVERQQGAETVGGLGATAVFIAGYVLAWTAFGLAAYSVFMVGRAMSIEALGWDRGGPYLAGGVIVAAAAYQLTPLKDMCLTRCRSPLWFLLHRWRRGRLGALRMGASHGAWCVGCCWALMAMLFALGIMNIAWMAFVAALIAAEKLLPAPRTVSRAIALALLVLGIAVAVAPERVPGLTLPGASMDRMASE